jgi:molecular chaperone DnaK
MIEPIIDRTLEPCRLALKDAKVSPADIHEVLLVGGSTRIPMVQRKVQQLFGKEPNRTVNPDEVVAMGAAVQGGVLAGDVTDMLLLDVTPLSLGIETLGGVHTILIQRNTTIPTSRSETFSTAADGQTAVDVHVFQGERQFTRDNRLLGNFRLDGITPAPRGVPQVEVTFDIDANGILNVRAKDKATGREQKITITSSSGLSKDEVEKLVKEAASNEVSDKAERDRVEERNKLDNAIYQTEKALRENRDKMPAEHVGGVESALAEAKTALDSGNLETMKAATEKLTQASYKLAEAMYQGSGGAGVPPTGGPPPAPPPNGGGGKKRDDVIDADFEEA